MSLLRLVGEPELPDRGYDDVTARVEASGLAWMVPEDWTRLARCRGMEVETFFASAAADIEAAKAICFECPVRLRCLDEAIRDPHVRGIWGGASERERQSMRRRPR